MYTRQQKIDKSSSSKAFSPTVNRFASSKSFVQAKTEEAQQPTSAAEVEKIKAAGSNWPDVSLFTNRPAPATQPRVQMKPKQGDGLTTMQRVKQYDAHILEASKQYGIAVEQIRAIIATESKGKPDASSGAAWGLMQVTKQTWGGVTQQYKELQNYDFDTYWKDPRVNILVGTATLKSKMKTLGVKADDANFAEIAVVAYNAGEGTVKIAIKNATKNGSENPTADYLKPENLKPAIDSTGIYSYYLTGKGKTRNTSGSKEEAIELKYQEISKYPQHVKGYLKEQENSPAGTVQSPQQNTNNPAPATQIPASGNTPATAPTTPATVTGSATVTATALNVRQKPSTNAAKLGTLSKGTRVKVVNKVDDWLQIDYQDKTAFISAKYAEFQPNTADLGKGKQEQAGQQQAQSNQSPQSNHTTEIATDNKGLEALMDKERLTPEEIKQARELIAKEADEKRRGDLYLALQAKVQYHSQRDNETKVKGEKIGDVMCNLTSLAMCLSYLGISNPNPEMQFEDALEKIRVDKKLPARTTAEGWGGVAKELGVKVDFLGWNVTQSQDWYQKNVLPRLRKGEAVMMSITGHIVRVQSVTEDGLVADDPFGKAKLLKGTGRKWESYNKSDKKWSKEKENAGEDVVWPWSDVAQHQMLWIAAFSK
jgi:hypothetical protein